MQNTLENTILKHWQEVADESKRILGPDQESKIPSLYNDGLFLINALQDTYGKDLPMTSLVALSLPTVLKEIVWVHMQFLWGNYPAVHRSLRFLWEQTFRAIYADTYNIVVGNDGLGPGPTVDDKIAWLHAQERKLKVIAPVLRGILELDEKGLADSGLLSLWGKLCGRVHPSKELWDEVFAHPERPMLDVFDEPAARETLRVVEQVFDLIWLGIVSVFHHAVSQLDAADLFCTCPRTEQFVAKKRAKLLGEDA